VVGCFTRRPRVSTRFTTPLFSPGPFGCLATRTVHLLLYFERGCVLVYGAPEHDVVDTSGVTSLHAYCDEAVFDSSKGRSFGFGALLTDEHITREVIDCALRELSRHKTGDPRDERTLRRGYFHASEDSKNAHSVLCTEINRSVSGEFKYQRTRDGESLLIRHENAPSEDDHLSSMLSGVLVALSYRSRQLSIHVEQRSQVSESSIRDTLDRLYGYMEVSVAENSGIPCLFPQCSLSISDKREPGLQVVDFLIWATNRTQQNPPKSVWFDRIEKRMSVDAEIQNSPESIGGFTLKAPLRTVPIDYPDEVFPVRGPESSDDFLNAACLMERIVRQATREPFPDHVRHLEESAKRSVARADAAGSRLSREIVQGLASAYVRLFDTLPIYSGIDRLDTPAWRNLLLTRKVASSFLSRGLSGVRNSDQFILFREQNLASSPDWFFPD